MGETNVLVVGAGGLVLGVILVLLVSNYSSALDRPTVVVVGGGSGMMSSGMMSGASSGMGAGMMGGSMGSKGMDMEAMKKADYSKALTEAQKAGKTEADLTVKGEEFMKAMMGDRFEAMAQAMPAETRKTMSLRMGLMAEGFVGGMGGNMEAGMGLCPMCAEMMAMMGSMGGKEAMKAEQAAP